MNNSAPLSAAQCFRAHDAPSILQNFKIQSLALRCQNIPFQGIE